MDLEKGRWTQEGLPGKNKEGPTAPPRDPAVIELEVHRDVMRFGAFGANVGDAPQGYLFEGVGHDPGPVVITVQGKGRLVEALFTEMRSSRDAEDALSLLDDEEVKAVKDVAGSENAFGALTLAAEVAFGEKEEAQKAAQKALLRMGERAAPWIAGLGLAEGPPSAQKESGGPRSFDEVLADFEASQAGQKKKKPLKRATLDDGLVAASFGNPKEPKWRSSRAISEDTIYLIPLDHYRAGALESAEGLIGAGSGLPAVTTWNSGGEGEWVGKPGEWMIVSTSDLVQEQDEDFDGSPLTFAAWKVTEGIALATFQEGGELLASLMGLPEGWPRRQDWQSIKVWIGE